MRRSMAFCLIASLVGVREAAADAKGADLRADIDAGGALSLRSADPLTPHMANVEAMGNATFSVPLVLPPAILAPHLSLVQSTTTGVSREVAYGWTLDGVLQIERPTATAFSIGDPEMHGDGEYLLSGDGFSGVIDPDTGFLRSTAPNLRVTATYDGGGDTWTVESSSGETWILASIGPGPGTTVETGWWRAVDKFDRYGNHISYVYGDFGRIEEIWYGQNADASALPNVKVVFVYPEPTIKRYDGRKGVLDELHPELTKIRIYVTSAAGLWAETSQYVLDNEFDTTFGVTRINEVTRIGIEGTSGLYAPGYRFEYEDPGSPEELATVELGDLFEHTFSIPSRSYEATQNVISYGTKNATKNETCTSSGFFDLNGDGVKEHVIRDAGEWTIHQGLPRKRGAIWMDARYVPDVHDEHDVEDWGMCLQLEKSWGHPGRVVGGVDEVWEDLFGGATPWEDEGLDDLVAVSVELIGLYDVDGDGYLDLVEASENEHQAGDSDFLVSYGDAEGFHHERAEPVPDRFTKSITLTNIQPEEWFTTLQLFVDVDGDGWIDILRDAALYGGPKGDLEVAYHSGTRGEGWLDFESYGPAPTSFGGGESPLGYSDNGSDPYLFYTPAGPRMGATPVAMVKTKVVDLNGDGLVDLLGQPSEGELEVAFGLGGRRGWSNAIPWSHDISACAVDSDDVCTQLVYYGSTTLVTHRQLLDVNGDSLPDVVDLIDGVWWPNNGSGFSSYMHALPEYLQYDPDYMTNFGGVAHSPFLSRGWVESYQQAAIDDLDGDGIPDMVAINWLDTHVVFGGFKEPHVLTSIEAEQGRVSTYTYRAANKCWPSGEYDIDQMLRANFALPDEVETLDLVTGMSALSVFTFEDGVISDQAFMGFESRFIDIDADVDQTVGYEEAYELNLGLPPLLTQRTTLTNWCRPFAPSLDHPCSGIEMSPRQIVTNTYVDVGPEASRLLGESTVETRGDAEGTDHFSSRTATYTYHSGAPVETPATFLDLVTYSGGPASETVWVYSLHEPVSSDDRVVRLTWEAVVGSDPAHGTTSFSQSEVVREWDDQGGLEAIRTDGRTIDEASPSPLSIEYQRDERGQVVRADDLETGRRQEYDYDFGGAVLDFISDNGIRNTTYTIDLKGRVSFETDDDNEVQYRYTYDELDRLVATEMSYDGDWHPVVEYTYNTLSLPNYTVTAQCVAAPTATCDEWSYSYESYDGGGNLNQRFARSPHTPGTWAYAEYTTDLFGRQVSVYDGIEVSGGDREDILKTNGRYDHVTSAWYYDPLGDLREFDEDVDVAGSKTIEREEGLETVESDENGYERRVHYNSRGLPTEVYLGRDGALQSLGTYTYDALGRVSSTTDGRSTKTTWTRDLAGRLRSVKANDIGERTYTYVGSLLDVQTDSAGGSADWDYDDIGRPTGVAVSDPISAEVTYEWTYDDDWVGNVSTIGASYGYLDLDYGSRGELTGKSYVDDTDAVQTTVSYTRDLLDRVTSRTNSATGRTVGTVWGEAGLPERLQIGGSDILQFEYDARGRLTRWLGVPGSGVTPSRVATYSGTDSLPTDLKLEATGGTRRQRTYAWQPNHLLQNVTDGVGAAAVTTTFEYDDFKQLTTVTGGWNESFTWDDAGNPTEVMREDGSHWTYSASTLAHGNQTRSRTDGTITERMTYDDAGQLIELGNTTTKAHYDYDGLGRLRRVWGEGSGYAAGCTGSLSPKCVVLVLDWDGDGNIIRRTNGDPGLASKTRTMVLDEWTKDSTGTQTEELAIPGHALGRYAGGLRTWYFQEADGHVAATIDDKGTLASTRSLSVFGATRATTGAAPQRFGEHGLWFELGGNLVSAGQRQFAPLDGQFLQPDPAMLRGPSLDQLLNPVALNSYRYAGNAPTSYVDRDGESPLAVAYAVYEAYATYSDIKETIQSWKTAYKDRTPANVATAVVQTAMTLGTLHPAVPSGEATAVRMGLEHVGDVKDALKAGETAASYAKAAIHHIATDKNKVSTLRGGPWTPKFEAIFQKAGMTLEDGANKVSVPGHYGPHPQEYHEAVYKRLSTATEGLEGGAYSAALKSELEAIGTEAATAGTQMNMLLTAP